MVCSHFQQNTIVWVYFYGLERKIWSIFIKDQEPKRDWMTLLHFDTNASRVISKPRVSSHWSLLIIPFKWIPTFKYLSVVFPYQRKMCFPILRRIQMTIESIIITPMSSTLIRILPVSWIPSSVLRLWLSYGRLIRSSYPWLLFVFPLAGFMLRVCILFSVVVI